MDEEHGFRCGRVHVDTRLNVSSGATDNSESDAMVLQGISLNSALGLLTILMHL